jgi:hypothetical protein
MPARVWSRNLDKNAFTAETAQHKAGINMRGSMALVLVLVLATSSMVSVLPVKAEARTIVVPDDY